MKNFRQYIKESPDEMIVNPDPEVVLDWTKPSAYPFGFYNANYKLQLYGDYDEVEDAYEDAGQLSPIEGLENLHQTLIYCRPGKGLGLANDIDSLIYKWRTHSSMMVAWMSLLTSGKIMGLEWPRKSLEYKAFKHKDGVYVDMADDYQAGFFQGFAYAALDVLEDKGIPREYSQYEAAFDRLVGGDILESYNAREFFNPCGRIWINDKSSSQKSLTAISFWQKENEVPRDYIDKVLDAYGIEGASRENVYIEFIDEGDETPKRTYTQYKSNQKAGGNVSDEDIAAKKAQGHLAAAGSNVVAAQAAKKQEMVGLGAMGSEVQGQTAATAGYPTTAQYMSQKTIGDSAKLSFKNYLKKS
jgi:hypothetical protein